MEGKATGAIDRILLVSLMLFSVPYAALLRLRAWAYGRGVIASHRLPRPVISVGNITVGGTGKTPTTAMIAAYLIQRGKRVAVLSRGYGGSAEGEVRVVSDGEAVLLSPSEAGDEPFLLAEAVPGLMVLIGSDRYRAGIKALEQLNPDILILDDGFQHLRLRRDLNILLLDGRRPFASGRTLPAGLLREPVSAVRRADLVIYTRCDDGPGLPLPVPDKPWCTATHALTGVKLLSGGEIHLINTLSGLRGMAFAGVADPEGFFASLREQGLNLVASLPLPDHCAYGEDVLAEIARLHAEFHPDYLITTAKDGVKLHGSIDRIGTCYVALMELRLKDPSPLYAAIEKLL